MTNIGMETEQIEYKKTTGELKEAIISIVAILNKHGSGELYFGVRNNGDILGQVINDETLRKVSQAIRNHITPDIFPEIPIEAIREAVINSYGHRLYNNNQCNEIDVFKDRIEIHTTGGFPKGHTPEEFLDGNKKAIRRNKLITGVLYYSKDMETFATGLKRIKDLCDELGCKVAFRTEKDDFVVVFYRNLREQWAEEQNNKDHKIPKHQNDVLDDVLGDVLENQIVKFLLENNKLNQKQLAQKTGSSIASVQRAMKKLLERGKIERIGGKRFGYWSVK